MEANNFGNGRSLKLFGFLFKFWSGLFILSYLLGVLRMFTDFITVYEANVQNYFFFYSNILAVILIFVTLRLLFVFDEARTYHDYELFSKAFIAISFINLLGFNLSFLLNVIQLGYVELFLSDLLAGYIFYFSFFFPIKAYLNKRISSPIKGWIAGAQNFIALIKRDRHASSL